MSFLDIAASFASNSLTLFVGTGLSKHLTDGAAPSWLELLEECTKRIDDDNELFGELFSVDDDQKVECKMELTICAQILETEYLIRQRNIREEICEILREKINDDTINFERVEELRFFIEQNPNINIITTNYDTILSDYVIPELRRVIVEGSPIARANTGVNIYHVHGCITKPETIVLTINDYFKFQHKENYFSRKLYTLIQETTVVVLGYSLGDFNLNRILNEARYTRGESLKKIDIYYVTRGSVKARLKRYYLRSYGVEIIEGCSVSRFVKGVQGVYEKAKDLIVEKAPILQKVIDGEKSYKEEAMKLKGFMNRIFLRASILGIETNNEDFQKYLIYLLTKKKEFTEEFNAWDQYTHLAEWLIEIASYIEIENSHIKKEYLEFVDYSFKKMSKKLLVGSAWKAYEVWESQWENIRHENQKLVLQMIKDGEYHRLTGVPYLLKKYSAEQ